MRTGALDSWARPLPERVAGALEQAYGEGIEFAVRFLQANGYDDAAKRLRVLAAGEEMKR